VRDSSDAITVQDFGGRILTWNRRAAEIYGYSEEEALQLNSEVLIAASSLDQMKTLINLLQQGKKVPPCESWRRHKNGGEIKIWLTVSLLFDGAGKPAAVAFTEQDIS